MSETKDAFKNYIDMILSSGVNESSESTDDLSDFDDVDANKDLGIFRSIFTSKEDSFVANEAAKYSWREHYDYNFDYNIDPKDYETEEEYLEAFEEARIPAIKRTETAKSERQLNIKSNDSNVYSYCKVFVKSSDKQSYYFSGNLSLNLGDRVLVPSERNNVHEIGTVIAVGKCFGYAFPCNIEDMTTVIKLLNKNDTTKECSGDDNILYEDDYIKISLVKWTRKNYLAGGDARAGTFIFENKYDKRFCIYLKDISVDGFLNQAESFTVALSGKQKEIKEMPFVYDNRIPDGSKGYDTIEFRVCYGTIKDGMSSIHLINKPIIVSDIISIKI